MFAMTGRSLTIAFMLGRWARLYMRATALAGNQLLITRLVESPGQAVRV